MSKSFRFVFLLLGLFCVSFFLSCKYRDNAKWSSNYCVAYAEKTGSIHFHCYYRTEGSAYASEIEYSDGESLSVKDGNIGLIPRGAFYVKQIEYVKYYDYRGDGFCVLSNDGTGWGAPSVVDSSYILLSLAVKKYSDASFCELNEKTVREGSGTDETYSVSIGASPVVGDVMRNDAALVSVDKDNVSDCYLADYDGTRWSFVRVSDGYAMEQSLSGCDVMLLRWGKDYIPCVTATKYDYDLTGYLKYDTGTDSFSYAAFSEGYRKIFKVLARGETPFNCEPVIASDGRVHYIIYNGDAFTASYVIYDPTSATPETPVWEKKLF